MRLRCGETRPGLIKPMLPGMGEGTRGFIKIANKNSLRRRHADCRTHPFAKLKRQGPAFAKEWGTHFLVKETKSLGHLYSQKVTKNFGQSAFLSAREIEHGRFRALFAVGFSLRCNEAFSHRHSVISQKPPNRFTTKDTRADRGLPR